MADDPTTPGKLTPEQKEKIADRKRRMAASSKNYPTVTKASSSRSRWKPLLAALVVLALVVGGTIFALVRKHNHDQHLTDTVAKAVRPPHGTTDGKGISLPTKTPPAAGAPTLVIYQDFQCPICKQVEALMEPTINKLADAGKVKVEYHMRTFLDDNMEQKFQGNAPNPKSSLRASEAASCADTVGAFRAYHSVVYKNQPQEEGKGYTDDDLKNKFAQQAGITGSALTTFQKCYDDKTMEGYATKMEQKGQEDGNNSTPEFRLNGKQLDLTSTVVAPGGLEKAITTVTKK